MSLLEGLLLHEIIFLFLGILLFLVLLFVLVYYVIMSRKIKTLPAFFIIPIIMIGWPSIEKIKFSGSLGSLEMALKSLQADPSDPAALAVVQEGISEIESRPVFKTSTERILSDAQEAMADTTKAIYYLDRILTVKPGDTAAAVRKATLLLKRELMPQEVRKIREDLRRFKTK
jgi:hypothetical protein